MNPLKGMYGCKQRLAEIQQKIDSISPNRTFGKQPVQSFTDQLGGLSGDVEDMKGPIKPFAPFGQGTSLNPQSSSEIQDLISRAASSAGVDRDLLDALVATESGYDPRARSRAGAMGLTQLMPGTATELGVTNPFDPEQNVMAGARYLRQMLDKFGDPSVALAAYNAGPGTVINAGNQIPNIGETRKYVAKVLALYEAKNQ